MMYLSNNCDGRPTGALYDFKRADLAGRHRIAVRERKPSLVIWQLHDCAFAAPHDPLGTLPYADLALEVAKDFDDPDLLSWAHCEYGKIHRLLSENNIAKDHLDEAIRLAESPYQQADTARARGVLSLTAHNDTTAAFTYLDQAFAVSNATIPRAYGALRQKSSLIGARIRWVLLRAQIREEGYTEAKRRRLMTVRAHILEKSAYREAGLLTLDIATHDIVAGSPRRARQLLSGSRSIFKRGGLVETAHALLGNMLSEEALKSAREDALIRFFIKKAGVRP